MNKHRRKDKKPSKTRNVIYIRSTCLPRKANYIQFSPRVKLLASRQTGTTSYFKQIFKTFQENYRILLNMLSRSVKQFLQCKSTVKSVICFTTKLKEGLENLNESRWVLSRPP